MHAVRWVTYRRRLSPMHATLLFWTGLDTRQKLKIKINENPYSVGTRWNYGAVSELCRMGEMCCRQIFIKLDGSVVSFWFWWKWKNRSTRVCQKQYTYDETGATSARIENGKHEMKKSGKWSRRKRKPSSQSLIIKSIKRRWQFALNARASVAWSHFHFRHHISFFFIGISGGSLGASALSGGRCARVNRTNAEHFPIFHPSSVVIRAHRFANNVPVSRTKSLNTNSLFSWARSFGAVCEMFYCCFFSRLLLSVFRSVANRTRSKMKSVIIRVEQIKGNSMLDSERRRRDGYNISQ